MKPMLASAAELDKIRFPVLASAKLDGVRCLSMDGRPMSRALKVFPNKQLQEMFDVYGLHGFDGELVKGPPNVQDMLSRTISSVMTENKAHDEPIDYYIFDRWNDSRSYVDRIFGLQERITSITKSAVGLDLRLFVHPNTLVNDLDQLLEVERSFTEQGYEGLMIRDPESLYKYGRSTAKEGILLKVKRFLDAEALIIGYEEEMENTNEATKDNLGHTKRSSAKAGKVGKGMLGKWLVRGIKDFDGLEFKVAGFNDKDALYFWENRDSFVGQICTYKYFPSGVKDLPRHPTFKTIRPQIDMSE